MTVTVLINAIDSNGFIDGKNETNGITISGTATDTVSGGLTGQTIGVTLNGATYTATVGSNGRWSASVGSNALAALVDGSSYAVTATVKDKSGNTGTATSNVTVDEKASLTIIPVDGNNYINASQAGGAVTISGTSSDSILANMVGQTLNLTLNGKSYNAVIQANGSWSVQVSAADVAALTNGTTYKVTATATDAAGNVTSATDSVVVDAAASISIKAIDTNGFIDGKNVTNGITISGTSTGGIGNGDFAGSTVMVTLNGQTYTGTIGGAGNWSVTVGSAALAGLTDGQTYSVSASATDKGGNIASTTASVTVDEKASLAITPVDGNSYINATQVGGAITISGTATDSILANLAGQALTLTLNGKTYTAVIQSDGRWSTQVSAADVAALTNGKTYTASAKATDLAGNVATGTDSIVVDTTASLTINALDSNGYVNGKNATNGITISGKTTGGLGAGDFAGQPVTVTLNGQTYATTIASNGSWSVAVGAAALAGLTDGQSYTVSAQATDKAGNTVTTTSTVAIDEKAAITIAPIDGNNLINSIQAAAGITISGTSSDSILANLAGETLTVKLNGKSYTTLVNGDGSWSVQVGSADLAGLKNGTTYTATATATDAAGNVATATDGVTYDTTVKISINAIDGNGYVNGTNLNGIAITGTATETTQANLTGQNITVTLNGQSYIGTIASNGTWSVNVGAAALAALSDGQPYAVTASAVDKKGHPASGNAIVTTDEKVSVSISSIGGNGYINGANASNANGIVISGSSSDSILGNLVGQVVTVTLNGQIYNGPVQSDGTWSVNVGASAIAALTDGQSYAVTASVTDRTGNQAITGALATTDETVSVAIAPIESNGYLNAANATAGFIISGTANDSISANVEGRDVVVQIVNSANAVVDSFITTVTNGNWSTNVASAQAQALIDGGYTVTAALSDKVGNIATEAARAIQVVETPPTIVETFASVVAPQAIGYDVATDINNSGQLVGAFNDASGTHGFLDSGGNFVILNASSPTLQYTFANGLNDLGSVVGHYGDALGVHGFLYSGGTYQTLDDPLATDGTTVIGINDSNEISGYYSDNAGVHGFLFKNGTYTTLNDPSATGGTDAFNINNSGEVAGTYYDGTGAHAFIYDGTGYTTLNDPLATGGTIGRGINNLGQVTGYYYDNSGVHGFVFSAGSYTTINDPTLNGTIDFGLNDEGQIVGTDGAQGNGFAATPAVSASSDSGALDLNAGHVVTITLQVSKIVNVTGAPQLQLNNNEFASYSSGSGSQILTFTYTVQPGDDTPDLQVVRLNLNGGSIADVAGNPLSGIAEGNLALRIDTIVPTVSISNSGGLTNQSGQTISGAVMATGAAPGAMVTLLDNGTQVGTAPIGTGGAWSTTVTLSGDGTHSIVAKGTDAAGNTGTSTPVVFTLDTMAPTVTISSAGGLTNQTNQTIFGTVMASEAAPGATVTLFDNGTQIGTAPVGSDGAWSTTVALSGDGTHSIVAKDIDAAGNIGTSTPVVFTLATGDQYVWVGPIAGSWNVAGNWDDATAGLNPAAVPPGGNDNVTINAAAGSAVQVISGTGNAASLTINGSTSLAGQFTTGVLTTLGGGDTLGLDTNGNLTIGAAESVVGSGLIQLDGGTLTDAAGITLAGTDGGAAPTLSGFGSVVAPLTVVGNALVQLNGGTLTDSSGIAFSGGGYLEGHGTVASALSGGPSGGFILATNGTLELASTVDVHNLELGNSSTSSGEILKLDGASTTQAVEFNGSGQTLEIDQNGTLSIGGFNIFDFNNGAYVQALANGTIQLDGGTLTDTLGLALDGGLLTGKGTLNASISGISGTVLASGGTLDLLGTVSGGPTLTIDTAVGSRLKIDGIATAASPIMIDDASQTLEIGPNGDLTITLSDVYSNGTITMSGGTLADPAWITLSSGATLAGFGKVAAQLFANSNVASATLGAAGGTLEVTGPITLVPGNSLLAMTVGTGVGDELLLDSASNANSLTFLGSSGTLELGANGSLTLSNALAISGDIVKLDGAGSALTDNAGINLGGGALTGQGLLTGAVTAAGTANITASGGTLEMKFGISDADDALALTIGSGARLLLDAASNAHMATFAGATGTLELAAGGSLTLDTALAVGADTVTLDDGFSAALTDAAGVTLSSGALTGAGIVTASVTATGAATITAAGNFLHIGAGIIDSGGALTLQVSGASHLELGGPSSAASLNFLGSGGLLRFTTGGSLTLANALAIGNNSVWLNDPNSSLTDTAGATVSTGSILGAGEVAAPITATGAATIEVNGGALELTGSITDSNNELALEVDSGAGNKLVLDAESAAHALYFFGENGTVEVNTTGTLTLGSALAIGANTVQLDGAASILTDAGGLSLTGGNISGAGNLSASTNLSGYGTVDLPLNSADTVTAIGGTLEFLGAVDATTASTFNIANGPNSVLKFDGLVGTGAIHPTIIFDGGAGGQGTLDLTSTTLENFQGVVAGFDEGEEIKVMGAASASLNGTSSTLSIYSQNGTSLGAVDLATSYAGDTFNVIGGVITLNGIADIAPTVAITTAGELTNQASQTISGTVTTTEAAPGVTVTLYDNGTQIGTAPLVGGAWSTTVTLVGDGSHSIVAKDTDAAGNTGTSSAVTYTLDTVAPTVAITTAGELTNQASQTISGTVTTTEAVPGATVTLYDNGIQIGTAPLVGGAWSTTVTLIGDGSHSIVAEDTDAAGNTGTSSAVTYTLDTVAPTVAITTAGELTNQASQTISGTVTTTEAVPGATVTLYDNGIQIGTAPLVGGAWSTTVTLVGDGNHSIVAKDTDAAGNTGSSAPVMFPLDRVAPTISIASPGGLTNQPGQTITGMVTTTEAAPGATVTLFDNGTQIAAATVGSGGAWSTTVTLSGDGTHSIVAKDTDAAGNTGSSATVVFTLDTAAPTVTIKLANDTGSSATDMITSDDTLTGSGNPNAVVHFVIDGSAITTTATANANGAWTFIPTELVGGPHSVVAAEADAAGNVGSASLTFTLLPQSFTDVWANASGGSWSVGTNWTNGLPGTNDIVSLPLGTGETVTLGSGTNNINQMVETGTGGTLAISGGALSTTGLSDVAGTLSLVSGTLTTGANLGSSSLAQTGGELNGSGTLTATGAGSFSGGTESGSGTTLVEGGGAFGITNGSTFGLDGGRTLQLGGSSTVTASNVRIDLNSTNPNTSTSDPGSGALTILNGARLNDETTSGFTISATVRGAPDTGATAAVNNAGTFIKSGTSSLTTISTLFNNTGTVNVQSGTLSLSGGGTDIEATYEGSGTVNFSGGTRTLDATSNIVGNATFSGGTTTVNGGTGTGLMTVSGGTATFNGTTTTGALTQSGGELNGSSMLTVTGAGSFSGGTQSGSGTTLVQGGAAFGIQNGTRFGLDGGRTLELGGISTVTASNIGIDLNATNPNTSVSDPGSGALTILNGATLNDETTSGFTISATVRGAPDTGATAAVNNAGTFIKSGTSSLTTISTLFNNTGTVNVQSGTLSLSGGGTDVGATYEGSGTVNFSGGTRTLDNTSNIVGNATFSGGQTTVDGGTGTGLMTVSGGTATFNGTTTTGALTQTGGELNGSSMLTVTGAGSFSGGTQSGSGTTLVQGGAAFGIQNGTRFGLDGGRTLELGGISTVTASNIGIDLNATNPNTSVSDPGSGALTILNGATLNDETTSGFTISATVRGAPDTGATAAVNNAGTFIKSGTSSLTTISTLFNNTGTVNVQSGTLSLSGGGTDVGATYEGSGTVNFSGGTRTLDNTSNIVGNATFSGGQTTVDGGTGTGLMTVSGGTATFNGTTTTGALTQTGGELNGSGTLTVTGAGSFSGGTESGSGTTLVEGGGAFGITNGSTFGLDGGRTLQLGGSSTVTASNVRIDLNSANPNTGTSDPGSGTLTIQNGATLNDETTSGFTISATVRGAPDTGATAAVNNAGTFIKSGTSSLTTISTLFNNTGTVNVQSGTLDLNGVVTNTGTLETDNSAKLFVSSVSAVAGNGDITGTSTLEFAGAASTDVTFAAGSTGTLQLDSSASYSGTITGFTGAGTGAPSTSDKIDLGDINFNSGSFTRSYQNNVLTVSDGTHTANVHLSGSYTLANFDFASDGSNGTLITDPPTVPDQANSTGVEAAVAAPILAADSSSIKPPDAGQGRFEGLKGILQLDRSANFGGTVAGIVGQDAINLKNFSLIQKLTVSDDHTSGALGITDGYHTANIQLLGNYMAAAFATVSDGHGGALVEVQPHPVAVLSTSHA